MFFFGGGITYFLSIGEIYYKSRCLESVLGIFILVTKNSLPANKDTSFGSGTSMKSLLLVSFLLKSLL